MTIFKKTRNKIDVMHSLEAARTTLMIAAIDIRMVCSEKYHVHADQLEGASEMIHNWILSLREEI